MSKKIHPTRRARWLFLSAMDIDCHTWDIANGVRRVGEFTRKQRQANRRCIERGGLPAWSWPWRDAQRQARRTIQAIQ